MSNLEIAVKYFEENPEPMQELCPELFQYWYNSKHEKILWSNKTGERYMCGKGRNNRNEWSVKTHYYGLYVRYIDEIEAIEFSPIYIHVGGRGKGVVDWKFRGARHIVFRGDSGSFWKSGPYGMGVHRSDGGKYYDKDIVGVINAESNGLIAPEAFEEVIRFDKEAEEIFSNRRYKWWISEWYHRQFIKRKVSHSDINELGTKEMPMPDSKWTIEDRLGSIGGCYGEIIDDDYLLLRSFSSSYPHNYGNVEEKFRVIITPKGDVAVFGRPWWGGGLARQGNLSSWTGRKDIANPEVLEKWNPTKYIVGCVKKGDGKIFVDDIITILRHPIVEKLTKAGYPKIAKALVENREVKANLKSLLGVEKEKKGTQIKDLGVNKHMLALVEASISPRSWGGYDTREAEVVKEFKRLYATDDVSFLSKETIEELIDGMKTIRNAGGLKRLFSQYGGYYYRRSDEDFEANEEQRKFVIRLCHLSKASNADIVRYYIDTKQMYWSLNNRPDIDITDFDNYGDLQRIHNALVELKRVEDRERQARYNAQQKEELERQKKQFEKLQEKRIEDYEKDGDKFCIRVPKALDEIAREGNMLHHCVGGYVSRHASGNTNILFLRKKGTEDVPFYTIEVCNGRVIQIHGLHNRWLGNNPEAVPFVYQWIKERGFTYDKRQLLNKACGYSPCDDNLDESYLTA